MIIVMFRNVNVNVHHKVDHHPDPTSRVKDQSIMIWDDPSYDTDPVTGLRSLSNYNLNQIVLEPTRVAEQTRSLIDHIYVSSETNISHCCVECIPKYYIAIFKNLILLIFSNNLAGIT